MKNYTFHWELKNLIIQFLRVLDDCVIKRYDKDRNIHSDVAVKVLYMPKQRMIHNLVNKQQSLELPAISVSLGGISRNPSRVFNKIDGPTLIHQELTNPLQPVPIDITMNVAVLGKYQTDMDQIISNMIPYFDPYVVISWKHPDIDQEIRSNVAWDGNISYNYPNDLQATTSYRVGADMTFKISGWLFKKADANSGLIHTVIEDFIPIADFADIDREYMGFEEFDRFITSGIPFLAEVSPWHIDKDDYSEIDIKGSMFDKFDNIYISGSAVSASGEFIDLYSTHERLSGDNPPFYGVELTDYKIHTDKLMTITLEPLMKSGLIDFIAVNEAGYGSLIKNAKSRDPWKDGMFVV